jgi:predicted XRE-type DNA-binding protein
MAKSTKSKSKAIVARDAGELAEALGLPIAEGAEFELRSELNRKIVSAVKEKGLTHVQVARLAQTSRSRITALLNFNSTSVSTDLMLRILAALGYRARVSFSKAA